MTLRPLRQTTTAVSRKRPDEIYVTTYGLMGYMSRKGLESKFHHRSSKHVLNALLGLWTTCNVRSPRIDPVQTHRTATTENPAAGSQPSIAPTPTSGPAQGDRQLATNPTVEAPQLRRSAPRPVPPDLDFLPSSATTVRDPSVQSAIVSLFKLYHSDHDKYSGEFSDNLFQKLRIFNDRCDQVGLFPENRGTVISIMLRLQALTYYYDVIKGTTTTYSDVIEKLRSRFITPDTVRALVKKV